MKQSLIENIKRRLTPQPLKCRADIEVTCFRYEGIDAIKAALFDGRKAMEEKDLPVEVSPTQQLVTVNTAFTRERRDITC